MNIFIMLLAIDDFSSTQLIAFYFIAAAFIFGILHLIINHASNADEILNEAKKQTALLVKMAKIAGVSENEINDIDKNLH